jgi:hypothetical protein
LISSAKKLDFRDNSDTVVYFCGTIKNLSENQKLLKMLASKNIEETLVKIIKELSKYVSLIIAFYTCFKFVKIFILFIPV